MSLALKWALSFLYLHRVRTKYTMFSISAIRTRKGRNLRVESFTGHIFKVRPIFLDTFLMCHRICFFIAPVSTQQISKTLSFILVLYSLESTLVKCPIDFHNYPVRQVLMFISFLHSTNLRLNDWYNGKPKQRHLTV